MSGEAPLGARASRTLEHLWACGPLAGGTPALPGIAPAADVQPVSRRRYGQPRGTGGAKRHGAHAVAGCPTIAPVRGSMSTAAKIPLAATAITTNSAPKPQVAWIPAMTGRVEAMTEKVTM